MSRHRVFMGLAMAWATLGGVPSAGAGELRVVSATPSGRLEGDEQQRIQIVLSHPVVSLGEAVVSRRPPAWLVVQPPMLASWRWAGTTELVGEPLAPLPRSTTYRLTVSAGLTAVDGSELPSDHSFAFTTPLPQVTVLTGDEEMMDALPGWLEEFPWAVRRDEWPLDPGRSIALVWNQPVDAGSLSSRLVVEVVPRPLASAAEVLPSEQIESLEREDPPGHAAWLRFREEARGAAPGTVPFRLHPHPEHPHQVFFVQPHVCWPTGATLLVKVTAGVASLEGTEPGQASEPERFLTPLAFAPLRATGRAAREGGGLDPERVQVTFSADVTWRDLAEHLTFRRAGEEAWSRVTPFPEEWAWGREREGLLLSPLALSGGTDYELCLGAGARDVLGRELGFPWCTTFKTARRAPHFYLVEADGVLEWEGPHLLPLRVLNVTSYQVAHRRVGERELVALLARQEQGELDEPLAEVAPTATRVTADRSTLVPVSLDEPLAGRPGVVLTRLSVADVVPGSEYPEDARHLRRPRSTLTQVTSLGLSVKATGHEGVLVWVTRLADAAPVTGARITVWDQKRKVLWRGSSDASGLARTPEEVNLTTAFAVTASLGDDLAYARTRWWEGHRGWEFNLPVDWSQERPVTGRLWADRGVVRPGETVHLKAVLRRQEERRLRLLAGSSATFVVRNSRGEDAGVLEARLDEWGAVETELPIPGHAPLGVWQVLLGSAYDEKERRFPAGEGWSVSGTFRVAEFRRPKFRVRVESPQQRLVAGDPLRVQVAGELLAGGAMTGAPARWTVSATRSSWRPAASRWAGWEFLPHAFQDPLEGRRSEVVARGEGVLDEAGELVVERPRVEAVAGFPATIEVEAEVEDVDRQRSAATASLTVLPGELFVGVERPPFFVDAADGVTARLVVLSLEEAPIAGVEVTVELQRRHWESVRRREVSGRYVFSSRPVVTKLAEERVVTGREPVTAHFALSGGGEYALVASASDARGNAVSASTELYVFGAGFTPWRMDQENRIELVPERDSYAPGETARVMVKSPWERATALVTVERAGVLEARVEELAGTMPRVEIPVLGEHVPNVFVSVVLLRGRLETAADPEMIDPGRPAYRVGYCELAVPPGGRRLAVSVSPAQPEYRPGQEAQATITVQGADGQPRRAGVTVWAVDAGVLELTGYRTPDLMAAFYARRGLGVTTAESRSRVVGRRSYGTKGDQQGGGGGRETVGGEVRRDFRALAVWRGDVVTGGDGVATVTFTLPDSLTTYRLMAVAVAGEEEFGAGDVEVRVSKLLGLEPTLPRFLRPSDRARAAVVVRNRSASSEEVEVRLSLDGEGAVRLRGTPMRVLTVPAGGSAEAGFGMVGVAPGEAALRFTAVAVGSGEEDAVEVTLPVLAVAPRQRMATFFATADRWTEEIAVPADAFLSAGGLEVLLAASPFVEATPGVRFLLEYPHECAEQVASRLLGMTAAQRLDEGLLPTEVDGVPLERAISQAVDDLYACQRPDGGFSFWPGGGASREVLSAHVAWALADARRAGAAVEERVLGRAAEYLSRALRRERWGWGDGDGWTAKVLISLALSHLERPEPAYFQWLMERREGRSAWARAVLAAAMLRENRSDPRAPQLLQEVRNRLAVEARTARLEETPPGWGWWVWWSEARGSASAAMALLAGGADDSLVDRLTRGLLDHLSRDRRRTTHDTAWLLQALAAYGEDRDVGRGARRVRADLAGKRLLRARLQGTDQERAWVPMAELLARSASGGGGPLPLEVEASGEVHGSAMLSFASRSPEASALSQGVTVERRFLDPDGRPVSGVQRGEEVTLEVAVSCPATRRFVAVEVPLPAGLEAIDVDLATTARRHRASDEEGGSSFTPGYDHSELRDDRIVLYATVLPAGRHVRRIPCRATTSGSFMVAPADVEEMYAPEVFGTTALASFEVGLGR